jgi:MFS family permease
MVSGPEPRLDKGVVRRIILLVGASHGFVHIYMMVLPPLYPVLSRELGLTYTELGLLFSGMGLSLGISQIILGPLSDRFGRKWLIVGGQFLCAAAIAMCGLVSTFWPLLFLQVLAGAGGSVLHPVGVAFLTDVTPTDDRGKSMGVHGSGGMLGAAFAPVIMVFLAVRVNWRFAMIVVGLLGVIFVPLMARYLVELPRTETGGVKESGAEEKGVSPFSIAALLMVLVIWVTRAASARAYQAFLPTFLVRRYDLSLELSAIFTTTYWIFAAFASLAGGYLADRYNHYTTLWLSYLFAGISLAIMLFARPGSGNFIYANFFLLGLFNFIGRPAFFAIYSEGLQKARRGSFYSLGFTVAYTVSSIVPGVMGWITDRYNAAVSFYPVMALAIATLVIVPLLRKTRSRDYARAEAPDRPSGIMENSL